MDFVEHTVPGHNQAGSPVARVDTHKQFRGLERQQVGGLAVILVRDTHPSMFSDFTECLSRILLGPMPSLWRISDDLTPRPEAGACCRQPVQQSSSVFPALSRCVRDFVFNSGVLAV